MAGLPDSLQLVSFDAVYQMYAEFVDVYTEITERVLRAARTEGDVLYAVPGDPRVGETTVSRILKRAKEEGIEVEIIHGISFIEPCLAQLGIDALNGIQVFDALSIAEQLSSAD